MNGFDVRSFFVTGDWPGMYVERWVAEGEPRGRAVFVHGGGQTGAFWTGTPDGREGWVQQFARAGWEALVVDWPGTGRSSYDPDLGSRGNEPSVEALRELLAQRGASVLVGHSIGGTLAVKTAELSPKSVSAIVAVNPGPPGNVHTHAPTADEGRLMFTARERLATMFASGAQFPDVDFDQYFASRVQLSPRVYNELGARIGDYLRIHDVEAVRSVAVAVVAAEQDGMCSQEETEALAALTAGDYILLGRDWGLPGHGHLAPIERGSERIAERALSWLDEKLAEGDQR